MSVERIRSAIERRGQSLLLRRVTGTQQVSVDVAVKGMVRGYHAQELIGGIIQGDREVIISNKEIADRQWGGPPRKDDRVQIAGKFVNVQAVDTVYLRDEIAQHVLSVRG